jgi:hypothetical protein
MLSEITIPAAHRWRPARVLVARQSDLGPHRKGRPRPSAFTSSSQVGTTPRPDRLVPRRSRENSCSALTLTAKVARTVARDAHDTMWPRRTSSWPVLRPLELSANRGQLSRRSCPVEHSVDHVGQLLHARWEPRGAGSGCREACRGLTASPRFQEPFAAGIARPPRRPKIRTADTRLSPPAASPSKPRASLLSTGACTGCNPGFRARRRRAPQGERTVVDGVGGAKTRGTRRRPADRRSCPHHCPRSCPAAFRTRRPDASLGLRLGVASVFRAAGNSTDTLRSRLGCATDRPRDGRGR